MFIKIITNIVSFNVKIYVNIFFFCCRTLSSVKMSSYNMKKSLLFLSAFAVSVVPEGAEDKTELPVLQVINFNCQSRNILQTL